MYHGKDITGNKYGRLTVIERDGYKDHHLAWKCKCECGNYTTVNGKQLRNGQIKSCGCYHAEVFHAIITKHGNCKSRIYTIYHNMKKRCYNIKNPKYKDYGARGITICSEWLEDFNSFYEWSIANGYADDLSIDRIDNDGNYSPDNCRRTNNIVQANNRRPRKKGYIRHGGK